MSATATHPATRPTSTPEPGLNSYFPWREWFALDHRSLALWRIGAALILFLDWFDRWPDLRTLHSDAGMFPRDAITGLHPFSVLMFHGSVWFAVLMNALGCLLAFLLLIGWRTNLMVFLNWLMFISLHTRLPVVMQGGDHLLRMLLLWSIFLPLGACWSVDAALSGDRPKPKANLSLASGAFILQLCIMYLFAGAWKWAPEWRGEGTAMNLALQIDYFATRFNLWLRELPPVVHRAMTHGTMGLEILGPIVLFLPFHVAWQRLLMIFLFACFHIGLAVTMELMTFPWLCAIAWLALVPTSFWDKVQAAYTTDEMRGTTLAYDAERPRARRWLALLRTFLILNGTRLVAAQDVPGLAPRLRKEGGWGVLDHTGQERYRREGLCTLFALSPVFYPLARLLDGRLGDWFVNRMSGTAQIGKPPDDAPARPRWEAPNGLLANALVVFCFVYIVLWNVRTFDFNNNRAVLPDQAAQLGQVVALEQGWGLFAPMPGRTFGWEVVVGTKRDGSQIMLSKCRPGEGGVEVDFSQPALQAASYPNGRWRKLMQGLPSTTIYPYLLPHFARYHCQEWNRLHGPEEQLVQVDVYWMRKVTMPPGEVSPPPEKILLGTYKPLDADAPTGPTWFVALAEQADGTKVDLLRGGAEVDWRRPDALGLEGVSPWQGVLFTLRLNRSLSHFTPGFAKYLYDDHNSRHEKAAQKVKWVEVFQVQEGPKGPNKEALTRYPEEKK